LVGPVPFENLFAILIFVRRLLPFAIVIHLFIGCKTRGTKQIDMVCEGMGLTPELDSFSLAFIARVVNGEWRLRWSEVLEELDPKLLVLKGLAVAMGRRRILIHMNGNFDAHLDLTLPVFFQLRPPFTQPCIRSIGTVCYVRVVSNQTTNVGIDKQTEVVLLDDHLTVFEIDSHLSFPLATLGRLDSLALGAEGLLGLTRAATVDLASRCHGRVETLVAGAGLRSGGVIATGHGDIPLFVVLFSDRCLDSALLAYVRRCRWLAHTNLPWLP
jgi:hypothetical protein